MQLRPIGYDANVDVNRASVPVQTILCVYNDVISTSEGWIRAIAGSVGARVCVQVESGDRISPSKLTKIWKSRVNDPEATDDGYDKEIIEYNKFTGLTGSVRLMVKKPTKREPKRY